MTRAHLTAATMFGLILAIGCGGAGGSSSTGSTDGTVDGTTNGTVDGTTTGDPVLPTPNANVGIEAVNVAEGNPDAPLLYVDPLNVEVLQTVQFQLVDYGTDGSRRVLPTSSWSISAEADAFASIAPTSGRLISGRSGSTNQFEVITRYLGVDYRAPFKVNPRQANLFTSVVNEAGDVVRGVTLEFFNGEGLTVGRSKQPVSGTLYASVPLGTTSFTVVTDDSLPEGYADLFVFDGVTYTAGDRDNPAPLDRSLLIGRNEIPNISLVTGP
ncbi:hypothetical protein EON79_13420 [bacterium]|nr:MAG: hypothetical protein EON79_13420 [bacterium]